MYECAFNYPAWRLGSCAVCTKSGFTTTCCGPDRNSGATVVESDICSSTLDEWRCPLIVTDCSRARLAQKGSFSSTSLATPPMSSVGPQICIGCLAAVLRFQTIEWLDG